MSFGSINHNYSISEHTNSPYSKKTISEKNYSPYNDNNNNNYVLDLNSLSHLEEANSSASLNALQHLNRVSNELTTNQRRR